MLSLNTSSKLNKLPYVNPGRVVARDLVKLRSFIAIKALIITYSNVLSVYDIKAIFILLIPTCTFDGI